MINLLPVYAKKNIKKEYIVRLTFVFFTMSALALISILLLLSTMLFCLFSEGKDLLVFKNINYTKNKNGENLLGIVESTNKKLSLLGTTQNKTYLHDDVFKTIIAHRGDVKITALVYEYDKKDKSKIRIQGISPTREKLFSFIKALETEGFEEVNSPVSNYVQDKDIPFFLEIIL